MQNIIEDIFTTTFDRQEVADAVKMNLQPLIQARKGAATPEEYFDKLSVCLGYHLKKVEVLKNIITTFFRHNTVRKKMDKKQISATADGIIASEADLTKLMEFARTSYDKTVFDSIDQRDASYVMTSMKLIIESCLLVNFIEYISNNKQASFLSYPPEKLIETFDKTLADITGKVLQGVVKSM